MVVPTDAASLRAAAAWAARLRLPLAVPEAAGGRAGGRPRVRLEVDVEGLGLRLEGGPLVKVDPRAAVERARPGRDPLWRAVGRIGSGEVVVDATAGLAGDAFHLARGGLTVVMLERVPLVAALLQDGLERARQGREGRAAQAAAGCLRLYLGDARDLLPRLRPAPAVVVLDPMYPSPARRGLPKKGMALFRELVGDDADAAEVLEAALASARRRVVVKRPRRAPALGEPDGAPAASGSVMGTTTRFDLYAPRPRVP